MDEEKHSGKASSGSRRKSGGKLRLIKRLAAAAVSLVLVTAAVMAVIYRDRLSSDGLRALMGRTVQSQEEVAAFSYENGSEQTFSLAGDGLAVASASGIQLLDSSGITVVKEICSMEVPAVSACSSMALFFDVGGSTCSAAYPDGTCVDVDAGDCIISASVNDSGYFAVISQESGSKGLVQVFDSKCLLLYQWYSGSGYVLNAQVSPDGRNLAVLCLTSEGSVIHFFKLNSEDEQASVSFPGEALFDLRYMSGNRICAVGTDGLYFASADGGDTAAYSFQGKYLSAYDFSGSGFVALYLSDYRASSSGSVLTVDSDGTLLGSAAADGDMVSLSANNRQVLLTTSGSIELYSQSMQLIDSREMLVTAKKALLRSKDVLLLSSYSAEPFNF